MNGPLLLFCGANLEKFSDPFFKELNTSSIMPTVISISWAETIKGGMNLITGSK